MPKPDPVAVLRDLVDRKIPCQKCGKPHPWRCSNPKHKPWFSGGEHCCRVASCRAHGTFTSPECAGYMPLPDREFARQQLALIDGGIDGDERA